MYRTGWVIAAVMAIRRIFNEVRVFARDVRPRHDYTGNGTKGNLTIV